MSEPIDAPQLLQQLRTQLQSAYRGDISAIELMLVALLAGGHVLLEDIPGVGKTTLAKALARCIDGRFARVQGTPDLMPTDITGLSIYDERDRRFHFHPGPIFSDVLLVDELNRMPPRTQSALLEAFGEGQVSVEGETHPLSPVFLCIATQNPHDQVGTYPLPESQMDRFLLRFNLGYPDSNSERGLLASDGADEALACMQAVCHPDSLAQLRQHTRAVTIGEEVRDYLLRLLRSSREAETVRMGASPRAGLGLQRAAQAQALLAGRDFVIPEDIQTLAPAALAHRLHVRGGSGADTVRALLDLVAVPR
jgi:MoxR-like ATPase